MKKIKMYLGMIIACMIIGFFLPGFAVPAEAAKLDSVIIDGIAYDLSSVQNGGYGSASIAYGNNKEEIYIPNEIEYNGIYYPIDCFKWSEVSCYDDECGDIVSNVWLGEKYFKRNQTLRKITLAKGVGMWGDVIGYQALEEVICESADLIGQFRFYDCPKLKSLFIPKNFKGTINIKNCPSVQITVDAENPYYKVIDNDIYSKDGKTLYNVVNDEANYKVKNTVTTIATGAFNGNNGIKTVFLPNSVKKVGDGAFYYMKNLCSIKWSKSIKKLPRSVVGYSLKVKSLDLPKNICQIKGEFGQSDTQCRLKKIYIRAKKLKKSNLKKIPKTCKIYVKNNTVKKQVRSSGFKGKIILKANMK